MPPRKKRKRIKNRRGRKLTYESSESRIFFALVFFLLGLVTAVGYFSEGTTLDFVKTFFGNASTVLIIFLFVTSFWLFGFLRERITFKNVIGLLLLTFATSIYLAGVTGINNEFRDESYEGMYGGIVGYHLAEFIGDRLFRNLIKPLMLLVIFLTLPLIISMDMIDYLVRVKEGILWLYNKFINFLFPPTAMTNQDGDGFSIPTMVGDFRRKEDEGQPDQSVNPTAPPPQQTPTTDSFKGVADGQVIKKANPNLQIKYSHKEEGDTNDMLMQTELKYPDWKLPPIDLLKKYSKSKPSTSGIKKNKEIIEQTLGSFGVKTQVVDVLIGPSVTQYALNIALGTKVSKIANLRSDIALALATPADSVRIEAPIPGTSFVGIEVPNKDREMISFREIMEDYSPQKGNLNVPIGKNVSGDAVFSDIQKMPHLLIAGATGSGKSVVTNSFIMSLLMHKTPDEVRFIMVDPKQVELSDYNGIPHLLTPVITDMDKVNNALKWAIAEMERRYSEFKDMKVRNIEGFNDKMGFSAMPYIVVVIDEMADMMMTQYGSEIESSIVKLAQKARATGIHLILATQRPSVDVITGLIKANIPGRVGMSVTTQVDSRVILDQIGAESLLGRGDLLLRDPGKSRLERIQGPFVSQGEVIKVVKFIQDQITEVEYSMGITESQSESGNTGAGGDGFSDDDLFTSAARIVVQAKKGSSSLIQRKLSIGYNRAARLLDELEEHGIVGPPNGSKPRDVLIHDIESFLQQGGEEEAPQ